MELNQNIKNSLISQVSELIKSRFPEVESSLENFKFILKQTESGDKDIEVHFDFNDQSHSITYFSEDGEARLDSEIMTVLAVEDGSEPKEDPTENEMSEENSENESEAQEVKGKSYDEENKAVELEKNGNQELKAGFSDEEIAQIASKIASKITAQQEIKNKAVENTQQENKTEAQGKTEAEGQTENSETENVEEKQTESEESEEVETNVQPEIDKNQEVKNKAVNRRFLKIVKLYH